MNRQDRPVNQMEAIPRLELTVDQRLIPRFLLLFQQGVMLRARVGCSLQVFLREEVGAGLDTLEKIQSIFLDGSPVDDLSEARVRDGSVLALSAAMPGLVGATLRRGGAYSSFRSSITYHETAAQCVSGEGLVQVKLFNLLIDVLGPGLLKKGVLVKSFSLMALLTEQAPHCWKGCGRALLDGKTIVPQALCDALRISCHEMVFLSVDELGEEI
ncbi:MAG: hypothetical protein M0024_07985 [Nitrospiraceae bacterium]|nr:hypothetical protein [Nitrospiraceae bacterium]